ncbi:MAG: histidine kinase [Aquabacterium sp.]|uniref:sensor histidine kinase n=1 Tax=Aquabacterium sp. TaxID=1872578 RepID=UPI0025C5C75F|nr:histidine kinase [Aquabacterium sp.]MBI5925345.1 histidine kinase [Aquabacterium sp.]
MASSERALASPSSFNSVRAFGQRGVMALLASAGVGVLMGMLRGQMWIGFLDSLCVGVACWFHVDVSRAIVSGWRWRRMGLDARQAEPAPDGTLPHWPGWRWMGPCVVLGTLAGMWSGAWLAQWLALGMGWLPGYRSAMTQSQTAWPVAAMVTLGVTLVVSYVFYARERVALSLKEAEAARRLAAESQLRLLQAQLEPHMLFNTLANLRVLIQMDAARAQAMLDSLISFLRATLSASRQAAHPLSDEFDRVSDYLALMQVRMGARLRVHLMLPDSLRGCMVPPLLLQPLVENAIQHGLEPKLDGGELRVEASRHGCQLQVTVLDTGLGRAAGESASGRPGTGFGLQQVRERLAVTWGDAASLQLADRPEGGTVVTLSCPCS